VDFDTAVVLNEAQLSKFVHEETHSRPRRSDHLRERLLADFRDYRLGCPFLAKVRQQQEQAGKALLARIEQLIDQVGFDADTPTQKMCNEQFRECRFLMNYSGNSRFFQSRDDGVGHGRDRCYAFRLSGQTSFAEEIIRTKNRDDRFLALLGNDGELGLAFLDVEDRLASVAL
jgi:hypothetical protein